MDTNTAGRSEMHFIVVFAWLVRLGLLALYLPMQLAWRVLRWLQSVDRWASEIVLHAYDNSNPVFRAQEPDFAATDTVIPIPSPARFPVVSIRDHRHASRTTGVRGA
jgi:hypothetical protein